MLKALCNWQEAKRDGFFTEEIKKSIREDGKEYTIFKNECGKWEMCVTEEIKTGVENLFAFGFARGGDTYASICFVGDESKVELALPADSFEYLTDVCGEVVAVEANGTNTVIPASHRRYIKTKLSVSELAKVLGNAKIV